MVGRYRADAKGAGGLVFWDAMAPSPIMAARVSPPKPLLAAPLVSRLRARAPAGQPAAAAKTKRTAPLRVAAGRASASASASARPVHATRCSAAASNGAGHAASHPRARDLVTRLTTGVLFLLLLCQLFTKKRPLATHLNSHEFGCYLVVLLLLNVPIDSPFLLKPFKFLYSRHPKFLESVILGQQVAKSQAYKPTYNDSFYKGIERGLQVGLIR